MKIKNQFIFNAEEVQLDRINELGNRLEKLNKLIDWENFRSIIEQKLYGKKDTRKGGRPPMDVIMMFKIIILQALNGDMSEERKPERKPPIPAKQSNYLIAITTSQNTKSTEISIMKPTVLLFILFLTV